MTSETIVEVNEDVITIELGNAISGLSIPGGASSEVQYNSSGAMAGTSDITITEAGPVIQKMVLSLATDNLIIYATDGVTELFKLDSNGNLYIKGSIGQL